ncbi:MAG TPA: DUF6270 domain-containing protein [Blastocatellia bacterium]|nr:DUF6270 domain-containing protein [Blastocatellia bacterium]
MTADPRHKYVVVLGSCCTADAIRTKNLEDIRGANLRLLWYQGRTSLLSMMSKGLESHEFTYTKQREETPKVNWGLTMVVDELEKRQQSRLSEVIGMSDALILDTVSTFVFPYLTTKPNDRYFLRSKEWERYVALLVDFEQKRLWEIPIEHSVTALREVLEPLYERQPSLRVIFHLPRPCFNDGINFEDPQLRANVNYYHQYSERLYQEASRLFPRVSVVSCGGERADPLHYNGPYPFHYDEGYMNALRKEVARLLE